MSTGTGVNVSKANALAVTSPPVAVAVSKAHALVVTAPPVALAVSKVNVYVVAVYLGPVPTQKPFVQTCS